MLQSSQHRWILFRYCINFKYIIDTASLNNTLINQHRYGIIRQDSALKGHMFILPVPCHGVMHEQYFTLSLITDWVL